MPDLMPNVSFYGNNQNNSLLGLLKLVDALKGAQGADATQNASTASAGDASAAINAAAGPPGTSTPATARVASQKLADMYQDAEQDRGLPAGYLSTTGGIESNHNPRAFNEFGYKGLMQLGSDESKGINVWDPEQNINRAADIAVRNRDHFQQVFGRDPSAGELYLMHQQGIAGGPALLKNPNMPAYKALMTAGVPQGKAIRSISANGGNPNAPASQFTQKWTNHFDNTSQSASAYADEGDGAIVQAKSIKTTKETASNDNDDAYFKKYESPDKPSADKKAADEDEKYFKKYETATPAGRVNEAFKDVSEGSTVDISKSAEIGGKSAQAPRAALAQGMKDQAQKADEYADHPLSLQFPGIKNAFQKGGGETAKTINELIKWGKRNPEEAGAAVATIGAAGFVGGRALLPLAAAIPGVAATGRLIGGAAKKMGEYSLVSGGLHELAPVVHGAEGVAHSIWDLVTGASH